MEALHYYSTAGKLTGLERHKNRLDEMTDNPDYLCQIVQGLLLHDAWTESYGFRFVMEEDGWRMHMAALLDKVVELDPRPLTIPRAPEKRPVVCCREFATLACALLAAKGVPARSRCGFAAYFGRGLHDHWIVEYWNGERWVGSDPQIDPLQLSLLQKWGVPVGRNGTVNPHDLSADDFHVAGKAWRLCRSGEMDPDAYGIDDARGLCFVRGQLLRDFASLNKIQPVPHFVRIMHGLDWQPWRLMQAGDGELSDLEWALLDRVALLSEEPHGNIAEIRRLYAETELLQVPEILLSMRP